MKPAQISRVKIFWNPEKNNYSGEWNKLDNRTKDDKQNWLAEDFWTIQILLVSSLSLSLSLFIWMFAGYSHIFTLIASGCWNPRITSLNGIKRKSIVESKSKYQAIELPNDTRVLWNGKQKW